MTLLILFLGILIGSFSTWVIMTLFDKHQYRHMIQRYREHLRKQNNLREKKFSKVNKS
jgi:hypothetical protein